MKKILIVFLITIASIIALQTCPDNKNCNNLKTTQGTQAYYLSPHGLGRTPEVPWALDKIRGQVKVRKTSCNISSINYILDNITLDMVYNYNNQQTSIPETELVQVSGGKVEFTYKFNYTKIENRNNITGFAYGSVFSDPITYYKDFNFCGGFLCWRLAPNKNVEKVTIDKSRMTIKRMDPYNQTDLENIQNILDNITVQIDPSNFKNQILQIFNQIFPLALNDSLNHEVFGETINYTYHSNTHGQMNMNIVHQLWSVKIDPEIGYKVIFVTKIDGWDEPICNITVPQYPASYSAYGGSQTYHLNCLYESVVKYVQSNGWLDTALNKQWDVDAFQFYAGDLFDLINNLYLSFYAKEILDGSCIAQKDGLSFISARQFDGNAYTLAVTYKCNLKGSNKNGTTTQVMKFTAKTRFYIVAAATAKTLTFKIRAVDIDDLSFQPVGNFYVGNIDLAMWKANRILQKIANTYTFGTDFPTITRQSPKTRVDRDWVFYYDNSHLDSEGLTMDKMIVS